MTQDPGPMQNASVSASLLLQNSAVVHEWIQVEINVVTYPISQISLHSSS